MKIGILTYHRSINYGAFLQAYCLSKYVKHVVGDEVEVEIIDYTSKISEKQYNKPLFHGDNRKNEWKKRICFERCRSVLPLSKESLCSDDLLEVEQFLQRQNYALIIVGSDEVWKVDGMRGFPTAYWLNFDLKHCEKISYAVSSRTAIEKINQEKKNYICNAVKQFRYLGARDQMSIDLIQKLCGKTMELNCDPAFLIPFRFDKIEYKKRLYKKYRMKENVKLLGVMISEQKIIKKIHQKFGKKYQVIAMFDSHDDADINMIGITPFEWIKVIGCLDFLITDRFHATVFAMKMGVPFLSIETYDTKENSKLYYLLNSNGLESHYIVYHAGNRIYDEILNAIEILSEKDERDLLSGALEREKKKSDGFRRELLTVVRNNLKEGY